MGETYEHEGVIYHEPRPRVVTMGLSDKIVEHLRASSHNVQPCIAASPPRRSPNDYETPRPPHEIDILIVRDRLMKSLDGHELTPTGQVAWPSGNVQNMRDFGADIMSLGGACVFFVGDPDGSLLEKLGVGLSANRTAKLWPGRTAHVRTEPDGFEGLATLLDRFLPKASVCVGLQTSERPLATLVSDSASVPYALVQKHRRGRVVCLPDFADDKGAIGELLSITLPALVPDLFPFRNDRAWLRDPEFQHPDVLSMEAEKANLRARMETAITDLDSRIATVSESETFLRNLLTTDGDTLKDAVSEGLRVLLTEAGLPAAMLLDVDSDPMLRNGAAAMREDLRIEFVDQVLLIDVAGRNQSLRQTSINQLDEHRRIYQACNTGVRVPVRALLVANFNYKSGLDPRQRGAMFGANTDEAEERLRSAGHGALSTFDLYRLVRSIQRKEFSFDSKRLAAVLTPSGILQFNDIALAFKTEDTTRVDARSSDGPPGNGG